MFPRLCAAVLLACCSCSSVRLDVPTLDRRNAQIPGWVSGKVYPDHIGISNNYLSYDIVYVTRDDWDTEYPFVLSDTIPSLYMWCVSGVDLEYDDSGDLTITEVQFCQFDPIYGLSDLYQLAPSWNPWCMYTRCTGNTSADLIIWSSKYDAYVVKPNAPFAIDGHEYGLGSFGMESFAKISTTNEGPYYFRLSSEFLDYLEVWAANMVQSITSSAKWEQAYQQGWQIGYDYGYQKGGMDASVANVGNIGVIPYLFGGIANVPINILNGLADFTVWNIPVLSVIFTFLFLALVLWVVKRFI